MLLIGIAVLSIPMAWVGYQLNWIRQRHEFADQYKIPPQGPVSVKGMVRVNFGAESQSYTDHPQWSLELFGEKMCPPLIFPLSQLPKFNQLYPEGAIDHELVKRVFGQDQ